MARIDRMEKQAAHLVRKPYRAVLLDLPPHDLDGEVDGAPTEDEILDLMPGDAFDRELESLIMADVQPNELLSVPGCDDDSLLVLAGHAPLVGASADV